ncbi:MAG: hypothetical protein LDLANPLL_02838 [Turneriella sp.]|nr:hypothetical protein [Turneriella sp.]
MKFQKIGESKKPAAIFLHGYGAHPHLYRDFIGRLAEKYYVYVPEVFGLSGECRRNFAANVTLLREFIENARLKESLVVGHSYGALVAMHLAAYFPELKRAIAVNPLLPNIFNPDKLRRQLENIQKDLAQSTGGIRGMLTHPEVGLRYGMNLLSDPFGYIDGAANAVASSLPDAQSNVPVDLVYADLDLLFHIDQSDVNRWREPLPRLQFELIPDYSHNWIIYHGSFAFDRLNKFL